MLKIARHQILEHQNDVPEEGIRQAAGERLLCPVEHEYKVGKLRELGVAAPGKAYDPLWLTANMTAASSFTAPRCAS